MKGGGGGAKTHLHAMLLNVGRLDQIKIETIQSESFTRTIHDCIMY